MPSHFFSVLKRTILAITVESSYAFGPLHYCNDDVTIVTGVAAEKQTSLRTYIV